MINFQESKNTHLALTQYYRWYQVYEVPFTQSRINNQLDILADEVEITSQAGSTKGKAGLPERLKLFEGWLNAHHVKNTVVKPLDNEHLSLEADILYQNIRPDGSRYSYTIHYSTELQLKENELPVFTNVKIVPTGAIDNPQYIPAYTDNRAKSFMHYWLYLMETPQQVEKFKELLSENFKLEVSTTSVITDWNNFREWILNIPNSIKERSHTPKEFSATLNDDGCISVSVNFEWNGISVKGKKMIAETRHEWLLENNMDERFARIKRLKVLQIKPFQVVE